MAPLVSAAPAETKDEAKPAENAPDAEKGEEVSLLDLAGVGEKTLGYLQKAGYDSIDKLKDAAAEDLMKIEGIGEKTAQKIIKSVKKLEK